MTNNIMPGNLRFDREDSGKEKTSRMLRRLQVLGINNNEMFMLPMKL